MPKLVKTVAKPKGKPRRIAGFWGIRYKCPIRQRSWVISTFCKTKHNAEKRLREFIDLFEQGKVGATNPFKEQRLNQREQFHRTKIDECLLEFEKDLRAGRIRARGRAAVCEDHGNTTMARLRTIFTGMGIDNVRFITVDAVNKYFDAAVETGKIKTQQTRKHYERVLLSFTKWVFKQDRLPADPLARFTVTYVNPDTDVVRNRNEFTLDQVSAIMGSAMKGVELKGITGRGRALLYGFCASTGFRAQEAASLRTTSFAPDFASVELAVKFAKNRRLAIQPIPPSLRSPLASFVAELEVGSRLWPLPKGSSAAELLRYDAARVGIMIGMEGKASNGGKVLDFHSFRHTFISNLERANVAAGLRERLSRATGGIVQHYTHRDDRQLAAAGDGLLVPDMSMF